MRIIKLVTYKIINSTDIFLEAQAMLFRHFVLKNIVCLNNLQIFFLFRFRHGHNIDMVKDYTIQNDKTHESRSLNPMSYYSEKEFLPLLKNDQCFTNIQGPRVKLL